MNKTEKIIFELKNYLKNQNIFFKEDYSIKNDTYFKTGGIIKVFITPENLNEFQLITTFMNSRAISYKTIGFTSNIILFDEIQYTVLLSTINLNKISFTESSVTAEAGYSLQEFVRVAGLLKNAKGFEGLEGIPGTVGGGIFMNAAAYGDSISDNLISLKCINNNEIVELLKDDCNFSYRNSNFQNKYKSFIILSATFELIKGDRKEIQKNIEIYHIARHSYQDFVYPSLGSVISINKNIYREIYKNNSTFYSIINIILELFLKNPLSKFIMRKRPSSKIFNQLFIHFLKIIKNKKLKNRISKKTINTLINDGTISGEEIVDYIYLLHNLTNKKFKIENELVINPIYKISDDFDQTLKIIQNQKNDEK